MSDLLRQSKQANGHAAPARPRPTPISILEADELDHSSSDSSASSASSAASVNTVRPTSREQTAPPTHWTSYFARELFLEHGAARYHVYLTPPSDPAKGPLFICHHGAGASGMSFAVFAAEVCKKLPEAGVLSLEARGHGSVVDDGPVDFSLETLTSDALTMIQLTQTKLGWPKLPPSVLVGHSLGGAIVTQLAAANSLGASLIGFAVLDVVEGSALEALAHMKTYLTSRPTSFATPAEAIEWHIRSRTLRNASSARASVPSLLTPIPNSSRLTWQTDLAATAPWWEGWFSGMSAKFLRGRGAKLLLLAGTDRLDRELMIGQMQGKFQLTVLPEAGHFVQEDVPEKTALLMVEFFKRNDRSAMVLPPKVSDLIKQGKKV